MLNPILSKAVRLTKCYGQGFNRNRQKHLSGDSAKGNTQNMYNLCTQKLLGKHLTT